MLVKKDLSWLLDKPFAHRGLHSGGLCPENSLCAFASAIDKRSPIELDVQVIASGEVVVFHDEDLLRLTGVPGNIEEQTFAKIKTLDLLDSNQTIPTLKQALELIDGQVPVLVEIKNKRNRKGIEEPILNVLREYQGPFAIQSFEPATLGWFKQHAPQIIRGQLAGDCRDEDMNFIKKFARQWLLLNVLSAPDFIAYDLRALRVWQAKIIKRKYPLILWDNNLRQ